MKKAILILLLTFSVFAWSQQNPPAPNVTASAVLIPVTANLEPVTQATISLIGNPGTTTWCYWAVSNFLVGSTAPIPLGCITNAPVTLSGSNYVQISPFYNPTVLSIDLLKTNSPNLNPVTVGPIVAVQTGQTGIINDQSNTPSTYTFPVPVNLQTLTYSLTNEATGSGTSGLMLRQNGALIADLSNLPPNIIRTDLLSGATWDVRIVQCFNALIVEGGGFCDSRYDPGTGGQAANLTWPTSVPATVLLGPYTYVQAINVGILFPAGGNGDWIIGEGDVSILSAQNSGNGTNIKSLANNSGLRTLQIIDGRVQSGTGGCVQIGDTTHQVVNDTVDSLLIENSTSYGIQEFNCNECNLTNNRIYQSWGPGIDLLASGAGFTLNDDLVFNNKLYDNTTGGSTGNGALEINATATSGVWNGGQMNNVQLISNVVKNGMCAAGSVNCQGFAPYTNTGITQGSGTVTIANGTLNSSTSWFVTGAKNYVLVQGTNQSACNGLYLIGTVTATGFTYSDGGCTTTPTTFGVSTFVQLGCNADTTNATGCSGAGCQGHGIYASGCLQGLGAGDNTANYKMIANDIDVDQNGSEAANISGSNFVVTGNYFRNSTLVGLAFSASQGGIVGGGDFSANHVTDSSSGYMIESGTTSGALIHDLTFTGNDVTSVNGTPAIAVGANIKANGAITWTGQNIHFGHNNFAAATSPIQKSQTGCTEPPFPPTTCQITDLGITFADNITVPGQLYADGPETPLDNNSTNPTPYIARRPSKIVKALTSGSALTVITVPLSSTNITGGKILWEIVAASSSGTSECMGNGVTQWGGLNQGGTLTGGATPTTTWGINTGSDAATCNSSNTDTISWAQSISSNMLLIQVTSTVSFSLTGGSHFIRYSVEYDGDTWNSSSTF